MQSKLVSKTYGSDYDFIQVVWIDKSIAQLLIILTKNLFVAITRSIGDLHQKLDFQLGAKIAVFPPLLTRTAS